MVRIEVGEPCPLPDDPVLAEWATTLSDTGDWGWILDSSWRTVFMTSEQRLSFAAGVEMVPIVIGEHLFGSEMVDVSAHWRTGPTTDATWRDKFSKLGMLEEKINPERSVSSGSGTSSITSTLEGNCRFTRSTAITLRRETASRLSSTLPR